MNDRFTDEQIHSLTPEAQFKLMKLGSSLAPSFTISYDWTAKEILIALYKMDRPLTVSGIMRQRPRQVWDEVQRHHVYVFGNSPRNDSAGRTTLTGYLIPEFVDTDLLIKSTDTRYTTYITTPELKELIRLWLGTDICGQ